MFVDSWQSGIEDHQWDQKINDRLGTVGASRERKSVGFGSGRNRTGEAILLTAHCRT